jgi:diketogulonate reductase-like aldo/keto reductase
MEGIARAHDTTVARVALAWVRLRPGVTSTIIGARRLSQLEDNLKSLEVTLTPAEIAHLDGLTQPPVPFPQRMMQAFFPAIHNGGTMVNGLQAPPSVFVMEKGSHPY